MADFLPLCDLLFNIVSLAAYFCDLVFDLLLVYAVYERGSKTLFYQCLGVIVVTTVLSQMLSLHWYLTQNTKGMKCLIIVILHTCQLGVLWRYAVLFAPVPLSSVKYEVRNLCILRMVHGFMQAAPMLLLQLTLLLSNNHELPSDLLIVSASLSLFSVCWALASFTKHIQTIDKFVLTWLGVISQLLWRAGTVTSRALALSAYASCYHSWIFLVIALHWASMFLWLLSPRSQFHGQSGYRLGICALVAAVYILAYINIHETPHNRTMTIFYVVMFLENSLLICTWLTAIWQNRMQHWELLPILTIGLFICGLIFMLLYYKYFHVKRLIVKHPTQSGVFNCRFVSSSSDEFCRKKKKPTSFVPPPGFGPTNVPFWRKPLPSLSENDSNSIGPRINIHQKLQEKRQKQLAELKIIEEEIKQGKLLAPEMEIVGNRQPIPKAKRHCEPHLLSLASLNNLASYGVNLSRRPPPRAPRSCTPELFLAPRYLYYDCLMVEPNTVEMTSPHLPSDLESQVSLPRSYTLPREFKYYRRPRINDNAQIVSFANSSDGDVDSGDDETDSSSPPIIIRQLKPFRHETKL